MTFGYVCENQEDYRALRRIAEELVNDVEMDDEEQIAQIDEICDLLNKWENRNVPF